MTDYSASLGFGLSLQFTPAPGGVSGVAVDIDNIHTLTPPNKTAPLAKFTPLDGAMAGIEQGVPGKIEITECSMTVGYTAARFAALNALYRIQGSYTLVLNDGNVISIGSAATGWSYLTKIAIGALNDSALQTIELTFSVPGGWTPATGAIVVTTTAVLTSGAGSINLDTIGTSALHGLHVVAIAIQGGATNGAIITVTKASSNGYVGLGAAFSASFYAGQSARYYPVGSAAVIGSTNCNLTLTGAGNTDNLTFSVVAIP